ncbi:ABC transporter ATP-binding protein [Devriesea agamarum]|uniref:ABC transporter ATP-binding protein n=1 Tax=Devriesea agamarum TaxID=472569 RepID=UPI00155E69C6|nr:ABC transporter ATP-binding protein [Devriesea agamarum]
MLSVQEVSFNYRSVGPNEFSVSGLNLTVPDGGIVSLVGPSGAGKSTILNILSGIACPTSGKVFWDSMDIWAMNQRQRLAFRRRYIGQIFQDFHLLPALTLKENIQLSARLVGQNIPLKSIVSMSDNLGIASLLDRFPSEVSGGQQQRCAVARAILLGPRILLADEATANLDTYTSLEIIKVFRRVAVCTGCVVVLSTHDPFIAAQADSVHVIREGMVHKTLKAVAAEDVSAAVVRAVGG